MELPDDVWNLIKHNAFSKFGDSFLKCTFCNRDIIQMFETKPFVKNLETICRFHKGQLLTNRGQVMEHSYADVNASHILTLEYSENVIKCTPYITPTCIVIENVSNSICFQNKHMQMIQLEPYKTFLDVQNNAIHICLKCRHERHILSRCFNCLKIYCRLPLVHSFVS